MNTYKKYKEIFANALEVNIGDVEKLHYKDKGWDSVGHMSLISSLEAEYGIELETKDIVSFHSFEDGIQILKKYKIDIGD